MCRWHFAQKVERFSQQANRVRTSIEILTLAFPQLLWDCEKYYCRD